MAQTGYTPIQLYYSTTAAAVPLAGNLNNGELGINITDGKLYYKNNGGTVTLLASNAGALGDVVGPASATDNALARFDATTGKLIQNSVGILSDAGILTGLTGLTSSGSITLSSLTSGRVPYASTGGLLTDSANLTFNGTTLTANALTTTSTVTINGGTANGVTYLNGSKVLTSGSALTFDGTYLTYAVGSAYGIPFLDANKALVTSSLFTFNGSNAGIGTNSPMHLLDVSASTSGGKGGEITISNRAARAASNYSRLSFAPNSDFTAGGLIGAYIDGFAPSSSATNAVDLIFGTGTGGTASERMRLDSAGNVGINTSSPSYLLDVNGTFRSSVTGGSMYTTSAGGIPRLSIGGGNGFGFNRQSASEDIFFGEPSDTGTFRVRGAGSISLGVGSSATTMTVVGNNGDVGIGTTSPAQKLDVTVSSSTAYSSGVTGNGLRLYNSSATTGQYVGISLFGEPTSGNAGIATIMGTTTSSGNMDLTFSTRGSSTLTERLRIAATGAFGLSGANYGTSGQVLTSGGSGAAPTWTTVSSASVAGSNTQVQYNNSGAFGASANFTYTAGTLSSLATTSSAYYAEANNGYALFDGATTSSNARFNITAGTTAAGVTLYGYNSARTGYTPLNYSASEQIWKIGATEYMRLTATGQLGIGLTPSSSGVNSGLFAIIKPAFDSSSSIAYAISVNGGGGGSGFSGTQTGGIKIKIDPPNYITTYGLHVDQTAGGTGQTKYAGYFLSTSGQSGVSSYGIYSQMSASTDAGLYATNYSVYSEVLGTATNNTAWAYWAKLDNKLNANAMLIEDGYSTAGSKNTILFYRNGSNIGNITTTLSSTAYNTSSDYRLKENVQVIQNALDDVMRMRPVTYDWIGKGEQGIGFIAHELQEVVPQAVYGTKDETKFVTKNDENDKMIVNEDGSPKLFEEPVYQGVDTSFVVPHLVKAIQELKAEFEAYKAAHP